MIAANRCGDVWVVGWLPRNSNDGTISDIVTIRYASNGVPCWTNVYTGFDTNDVQPMELVVDEGGNVYIDAWVVNWADPSAGTLVDSSIVKYDAAGNLAWTKHYLESDPDSGEGLHRVWQIALDDSGDLLEAGDAGGEYSYNGGSLVRFRGDGTALQTNFISSDAVWSLNLLLVDRDQNVFLVGEGPITKPDYAYVIMKYSPNGTLLWTNNLPGDPNTSWPMTCIDPLGNVFFIGGSPSTSARLYQAVKFSPAGIPLWTNLSIDFGGTNGMILHSAVDSAGNLYVTGNSLDGNGYYDCLTFKYSSLGQLLWTKRWNGLVGYGNNASALAVDPSGNVFITGQSGDFTFDQGFFCTVKYSDSIFYTPPTDFTGIDTLSYTLFDSFGHSATGTVDVTVAPGSFRFHSTPVTKSNGVQLLVDGFPGTNKLVLEVSSNFWDWQPILTNAPSNGSVQFLDPAATGLSPRFYRARQTQ